MDNFVGVFAQSKLERTISDIDTRLCFGGAQDWVGELHESSSLVWRSLSLVWVDIFLTWL